MKKQVFNPYMPSWEYVPDGEPHIFGDRVYVYGSHDMFNGWGFCLCDYVCYSAPVNDLADWRYEGVIYTKESDPFNPDGKMVMNAPDVTQGPDGRYYLYYVLDFSLLLWYNITVDMARLGELKQPLSPERSGSCQRFGIYPLGVAGFSSHPCAAPTRRSNLCELETCVIDLLISNPCESEL